jgi:trans-aconitate methyltransferase
MTQDFLRVSADWLALREGADAAARATPLVQRLRQRLPADRPLVIHDLGTGTGSMVRWLAPQLLPSRQHWVLHDRDVDLLARALDGLPGGVSVSARVGDITQLTADDLRDADLVTGSALLDMLTADEIDRVVAACAATPTLMTISVVGRIELSPNHPLDAVIAEAFNAHQRRTVGDRTLLGPDAVEATVKAFGQHGIDVVICDSPWQLGPEDGALASEWLLGWLGAAAEQDPKVAAAAAGYRRHRVAAARAGQLRVVVHHHDLLAAPD